MEADAQRRLTIVERAACAGGDVALERFRTDIDVETKGATMEIVTQADRDAQQRIVELVLDTYPNDEIVGEEGNAGKDVPTEGAAWVIDPIDGTNNYVRDVHAWATSVSAVVDGEPIASANVLPALGDVYVCGPSGVTRNGSPVAVSDRSVPSRCLVSPMLRWPAAQHSEYLELVDGILNRFDDMRRIGSAQITLSLVASGGLDGAVSTVGGEPWDTIGGVHMIRRAGGVVTDVNGEPWHLDSRGLVASNGHVHDAVLSVARESANLE